MDQAEGSINMDSKLRKLGLVLAIALLLCLFPMPFGYFTLVRFIAMTYFVSMSYSSFKSNKMQLCILFGALALLFQPFVKIVLGRGMWCFVDVVVSLGLMFFWWKNKSELL